MQKYQDKASTCFGWEIVSLRLEEPSFWVYGRGRFSETLRTFQVTGNTRLKVCLKFLLSLCILRHLNAFENQAWKDSWDVVMGPAGSGHSAWLGRSWARSAVPQTSVPQTLAVVSLTLFRSRDRKSVV